MIRLLPHEWLFGGYMLITWLRLLAAGRAFGIASLVYFACLVIAGGLALWGQKRNTPVAWRWRLVFYPLAMNVLFQQMRTAIPVIQPVRFDHLLRTIDGLLLADSPAFLLEPYIMSWATDVLSLCYLLFFPYLLFSLISYFTAELPLLKAFIVGLFSLYGLGFLGYTLIPAAGPHLAFAGDFHLSLTGGVLTQWNAALVGMGSTGVDVFPSLHVAVSGFLLGFDFRHKRRRFWLYLVPCTGLWFSTQYLRYHYLIDLLCGVVLAFQALWIAERHYNQERISP